MQKFDMGVSVMVVDGDHDSIPNGATGKLVGVLFDHGEAYAIIKWHKKWDWIAPDGWSFERFRVY